ncbi:MAG: cation:proton antiporter [Planctomycetes bacterium]|nr:cation:proton antiporter [Planctomycetota bacterium]
MHNIDLILTFTCGLAVALVLGWITHRLGLSPIVGYLLAGIAVGPNTPGFVADRLLAEQMAEIGVVLLMFGVGLHFHLNDLLAVRRIAVPGAVGQSIAATLLGALAVMALGWSWQAGLVYGLAISVASTVVLTRVLSDFHELHTRVGHIAIGWLVVEDLFTVVVLVLMPEILGSREGGISHVLLALGLAALKIGLLVATVFVVGGRVIPWLLARAAASGSRELFTLTILVVALGIAVGSATIFGVSMALGAFLAGMVVGRSEFSLRAATEALPMRDAFAVLFFVSTGMLFDPAFLVNSPGLVALTLAIILIGKPLAAFLIVWFLRYPVRIAFAVAVALAQIGEFSFILAALGMKLKILPDSGMNALVAAAIVSISLNPLLYRLVNPFEAWASRQPRLWKRLTARMGASGSHLDKTPSKIDAPSSARYRAIVIGYGPVGSTLTRLLRENGIEPTIIEMNLETVRRLRNSGLSAVYGDSTHLATLESAGVDQAASIILSASELHGAVETIRLARKLNPDIQVLVRTTYLREAPALVRAGAHEVFAGEGEVALSMTKFILQDLGATPEQIDRERERLRGEILGLDASPSRSAEAQEAHIRAPSQLKKTVEGIIDL